MVATPPKTVQLVTPDIAWVKPPDDFILDETPVGNNGQPLLAGALRESLELTDRMPPNGLIASNLGICTRLDEELTLKAPDWLYVARVNQPSIPRKSYTPHLEGEIPELVMEFLSGSDGEEYSHRRTKPIGRWYFYEQVLKVPNYVIFEPESGLLEVYRRQSAHYALEPPDEEGRHWFGALGLFLGTWRGWKEDRDGYWLRWWDAAGNLLPWAVEQIQQERDQTEQERQRAEQEKQRADRLAQLLRSQGIAPDAIM